MPFIERIQPHTRFYRTSNEFIADKKEQLLHKNNTSSHSATSDPPAAAATASTSTSSLSRCEAQTVSSPDSSQHDKVMKYNDHVDSLAELTLNSTHNNDASQVPLKSFVKIVAPMVRYSKLAFRLLCRDYNADIAFTPMIIAEPFNRSKRARDADFTTTTSDRPLVVQFATNDPIELAAAARKVASVANAVDLNCGCPQTWAQQDGIGASLIRRPQLIKEMVQRTVQEVKGELDVSIKIRIRPQLRDTIDLVQQAEAAGVSFISVHGRTIKQKRGGDVDLEAVRQIKQVCRVPVIANGDMNTPGQIEDVVRYTNVDGVMCARGLQANPALFAGYHECPFDAALKYHSYALQYGGVYYIHHNHLIDMLGQRLSKWEKVQLVNARSMAEITEYFQCRNLVQAKTDIAQQRAVLAPLEPLEL
jgi:tRNA-dihydrouridine synthase 4